MRGARRKASLSWSARQPENEVYAFFFFFYYYYYLAHFDPVALGKSSRPPDFSMRASVVLRIAAATKGRSMPCRMYNRCGRYQSFRTNGFLRYRRGLLIAAAFDMRPKNGIAVDGTAARSRRPIEIRNEPSKVPERGRDPRRLEH